MKSFFVFLLSIVCLSCADAQILYNYTSDKTGKPIAIPNEITPDLDRVNGGKKPWFPCSTGFSTTGFPKNKDFSSSYPAIELSVTPKAGYYNSYSFIACDNRRSSSGTLSVKFAYSTDQGKTWIAEPNTETPKNGSCGNTSHAKWDFADFTAVTQVKFRIYGYNASSTSGVLQLLDIQVGGSLVTTSIDNDKDGYPTTTDCDDNNPSVHPNAPEACNGIDDNCDGSTDENVESTFYADTDGDGFGNFEVTIDGCVVPAGYVANHTDCNDNIETINPSASEICNGLDDNCNGQTDEQALTTFYADEDHDGYGDNSEHVNACTAPNGYVTNVDDCNDINADVHPNAIEKWNGIDDNCDGRTDENFPAPPITLTPMNMKVNLLFNAHMVSGFGYNSKGDVYDENKDPFKSAIDSMNIKAFIYTVASPSHNYHFKKGEQARDGKGYNFVGCDGKSNICISSKIEKSCVQNNVGCLQNVPTSFFPQTLQMAKRNKAKVIIVHNMKNSAMSLIDASLQTKDSTGYDVPYIFGALEIWNDVAYDNRTMYPNGAISYRDKLNPVADSIHLLLPKTGLIVNAGDPQGGGKKGRTFNSDLRPNLQSLNADGGSFYNFTFHVSPLGVGHETGAWIDTILKRANVDLPRRLDSCYSSLAIPVYSAENGTSGSGDFGEDGLYGLWTGNYAEALWDIHENLAFVDYENTHRGHLLGISNYFIERYSLNLTGQNPSYHAYVCWGRLFPKTWEDTTSEWYEITTTLDSVSGKATHDKWGWHVLLVNDSHNDYSIGAIGVPNAVFTAASFVHTKEISAPGANVRPTYGVFNGTLKHISILELNIPNPPNTPIN